MRPLKKTTPKTPPPLAPKGPYTRAMSPLSIKLTGVQMDRLLKLRKKTGLQQTEIIRRAVDHYLDALDQQENL
jgi:Ribbon-helix-helix protein, copG family